MDILITGASKGIGRALALNYCNNSNSKLYLVARDFTRLEELKNEITTVNPDCKVFIYPIDIGISEDLKILADKITLDAGKIDILINNAGILFNKKFWEISNAEIYSMFQVNFFAPANLIRLLIPLLSKSDKAHVVNIGSMGGFQGSSKYPGLAYYSASKAALAVLTECLAAEYNNLNIAFNYLALGAVQTEMFSDAFPGAKAPVNASEMADFIVDFTKNPQNKLNGRIIPVTLQNTDN